MAREGQVLKRLFDAYQARRCPTEEIAIRSHYLEVSRRSTFLPSLGPLDKETFETLFRQYPHISVKEFLLSLGLEELLSDLEQSLGEDLSQRNESLPSSSHFRRLLASSLFRKSYEDARIVRRAAFLAYLESFPLLLSSQTLHLVDIGWKGTIQDNIFNLLRQSGKSRFKKVEGYYVGLIAPGAASSSNRKEGILFTSVGGRSHRFHVFNENRALFEVMLAADHGSAWGYQFDGEGKPQVSRSEFTEELIFLNKVQPALRLLEARFHTLDAALLGCVYTPEWLLEVTALHHARMVFGATAEEISWFKGIYHMENFGVFERSEFGAKEVSHNPLTQLRFCVKLYWRRGKLDLGFWPWMTCLQMGGRFAALAYRVYRLRE
jgi:hypothetical protein